MATTERKMGPKGLLHKANTAKVSAIAFIAAHRDYLVNGEVGYVTSPIIAKLDAGELLPTPALNEIKMAVMGHIMVIDLLKNAEKEESAPKAPRTTKPFVACIRDGSGQILKTADGKDMKSTFDLPQRASEWVDRRLFESSPDCFGEVTHTKASNPLHATDLIMRDDSIARILKRPLGSVCKTQKGSSSLGFGVKAKPSVVKFSRG